MTGRRGPLKVFISYSHDDEGLCEKLLEHLGQLRNDGLIDDWHDRKIHGGEDWAGKIDHRLETADIVLLLISSSFIDSRYCYEIEMTRALARDIAGEARVIPVILRPADWQSAPFGTLQALPKNGKPIVQWSPPDAGYLDVARGLRRVIGEMGGPTLRADESIATGHDPGPRLAQIGRRKWVFPLAALLVTLTVAAGWWLMQPRPAMPGPEQPQLELAQRYMSTGRYAEALKAYGEALRLNPKSAAAQFGLRKAALPELLGDPERFSVELDALLRKAPNDPNLILLDGDRRHRRGEIDKARERYQKALELKPQLADASFRLGVLSDQSGDPSRAFMHYRKAVELSPETPHYRSNLAFLYFKQGAYDRAIDEYQKVARSALAAVELAKAHWMKGELDLARKAQLAALRWLEDEAIALLPRNRGGWYFPLKEDAAVRVITREEKICYARLALSATLYLEEKPAEAEIEATKFFAACSDWGLDLKPLLSAELAAVAQKQPWLNALISEYQQHFLSN